MKTEADVHDLEKVTGQLASIYSEITALAKKSPSDAVNGFKLRLINAVLITANRVLGEDYIPFSDFTQFDADDVPSTSDVALLVGQYIEEAERFRSDNVQNVSGAWMYIVSNKPSEIRSRAPSRILKVK